MRATEEANPPVEEIRIVVIGKSVLPYWSNVEKGVEAAGKDLGVETIFFVPPKEDVAAQIQTMETYIAQGVTGIAVAPSDPEALEPVMKKAAEAGILVTTLDTPPIENSVSLVYIGTDNFTRWRDRRRDDDRAAAGRRQGGHRARLRHGAECPAAHRWLSGRDRRHQTSMPWSR